ncbi:MAG: acetyl-CoA carboxylase biotin carboxyl carrier protein [bacterium]|nr:acetyl-CoA carboxylase biotin carboxyl carrier protein [bacterium]
MHENEILELIKMLKKHKDVGEIEIQRTFFGFKKIRVSRAAGNTTPPQATQLQAQPSPQVSTVSAAESSPASNLHPVKAPMVGTFYRSPSPDTAPFLEEGDRISPGKVICIIEAMKLMNEIEGDCSGVVKEIVAEDGQAVEFGQTLFLVEKA